MVALECVEVLNIHGAQPKAIEQEQLSKKAILKIAENDAVTSIDL